ncbi:chemokine XC receptor 1-like [Hemibagrus wyckioides]|uniref:chemokine XC receptor 1-like n=1 Tax=Hemibagrus wyckioides TaxID=337641 RepID=UPI00266DA749|nr:chemokine XC receptor 1-like [Hemibagrus wyckioides]
MYDSSDDLFVHMHNSSLFVDELFRDRSMAEDRNIAVIIILSTLILISLIGNLMVVLISVFYPRLRSVNVMFILNLALSDLLSTVGLMFWFYNNVWSLNYGDEMCEDTGFAQSAGFYSSVLFLVLISVQCYQAVVHPVSDWKYRHLIAFVLWMVSFYAALPSMVHIIKQPLSTDCMYRNTGLLLIVIYRQNIVFVFTFLFMGFCYIRILQTILKSATNQNQRHRTTGLAFFLAATFFICWAPYNIMTFMHTLNLPYISPLNLKHFLFAFYICRLLAFSRCLNPVIYCLFGLKFRQTAREILQRRATSAETQTEERHSGTTSETPVLLN